MPSQEIKAAFTEPMLLLPSRDLPEGANWAYELKLDGYRAMANSIRLLVTGPSHPIEHNQIQRAHHTNQCHEERSHRILPHGPGFAAK